MVYRFRRIVLVLWLALVVGALYLYFFHPATLKGMFDNLVAQPKMLSGSIFFVIFCVRGFTLVPSAYFVIAAIPIIPPVPLFFLALAGIVISAASIYYFSEAMALDEFIERNHKEGVAKFKNALQRYELPIIIGWSFLPLLPTDVICYICGTLKVDFKRFLLGILIGEGSICTLYIFLGDSVLRYFAIRP
jgi:uncharacterized membrane protein YdjX (TVP38/TMEM64 family)